MGAIMATKTLQFIVFTRIALVPHTCSLRSLINILRPRQNGRHFADDNFKCIFLNENVWSSIKMSLKFVRKGPINNIPALVQIMAWRRSGDKPLSEPIMVRLPTHICVTRPQWVNDALRHNFLSYCYSPSGRPGWTRHQWTYVLHWFFSYRPTMISN